MSPEISLKFYGCRGSYPVAGPQHVRYGGATSCVVVRVGELDVVLDAGSGLATYGHERLARYRADRRPITTHLFVTHAHFDHLQGLPFFAPIYMPDSTLRIFGPRTGAFESFEATITALIRSPFFPVELHEMHAHKEFSDYGEADVVYFVADAEGTSVRPLCLRPRHPDHAGSIPDAARVVCEVHCLRGFNHPKAGVNIYKVVAGGRSVVYATDVEGFVHGDRRLIEFARGADVLIHDAMYTEARYTRLPVPTQGFGHSTVAIAAEVAREAGVGRLFLFHHEPTSTDTHLDEVDRQGKAHFEHTAVAYDGLEVSVG